MPDIIWEDPPPTARIGAARSGKYAAIARALRDPDNEDPDSPGKSRWARLPQDAPPRSEKTADNLQSNIRRGINGDFKPKGAFDAAVDGNEVWVRYLGEPPPEPPKAPSRSAEDGGDQGAQGGSEPRSDVNPAEVRAWARNNGFSVPDRGRLPQNVIDAYRVAQQRRHIRPVPPPEQVQG